MTYLLPSENTNIIKTESDPSTESASDEDCCRASGGTDAELLQACVIMTTEDNESFLWNENECTRTFDNIITYLDPIDMTIIFSEIQNTSIEEST